MKRLSCLSYAGYCFPAEIISSAVWLYFRFPLSLRMVDELLAARGIVVSHETVRQWALKFGQLFANQIRRRLPAARNKWHPDEVVFPIFGVKHWLWRAVDQTGTVLDILAKRPQHAGCLASAVQADEAAMLGAARHDNRQAGELWGGRVPGHAFRRASEAQRPEEQSGELTSTHATTRAPAEML